MSTYSQLIKQAFFEDEFTDAMFGEADMAAPGSYNLDDESYDANEKYFKGLYKGHQNVFNQLLANPVDETVTFNPDVQGHKIISLDVLPAYTDNWLSVKDWNKAIRAAMKARDIKAIEPLLAIQRIRGNTQPMK